MYRFQITIVFGVILTIVVVAIDARTRSSGNVKTDRNGRVDQKLQLSNQNPQNFTPEVIDGQFTTTYNRSVDIGHQIVFVYNYNETNSTTVRVSISSSERNNEPPIIVVVRQEEGVMSWAVPLYIDYIYSYHDVSRTLCPAQHTTISTPETDERIIYIEVSSMAKQPVSFHFMAELLEHFDLRHGEVKNVTVSPSEPQYFKYIFPKGVSSVLIKVKSDSNTCMVVSIQDIKCPVYDLDRNVEFAGKYQTMSTQAAMLLQKYDYQSQAFYVVLIVKPRNIDCAGIEELQPAGANPGRRKNVTILVDVTIPASQYYKGIFAASAFFLAFYAMAVLMIYCYNKCGSTQTLMEISDSERDSEESRSFLHSNDSSQSYGTTTTVNNSRAKELSPVMIRPPGETTPGHERQESLDESDLDFLHDADQEKDIIRTKTALFVTDLSRKSHKKLAKTYKIYHWNLFTIAIFYGLPVAQLVITYQKVLVATGNEDLCYYNFDCARPLGVLSSFNNVFSNIGYVLLGLLFIFLVMRRDAMHKKMVRKIGNIEQRFGIPQHFGLFYAMGLALVMEGIMSACYHVCPNYSNFQFDTSFMYIIACLCMLKIYQSRHPDINAKAYQAYLCMALVIFMAVIGVVYATSVLWIFYAVVHIFVSLLLSAQIYYMGRWQIDIYIFKRLWHVFVTDCLVCARPTYKDRFILLLIGNVVNWTFAIYGAVQQPADFASYLLAIFIGNLLLYCLFYILMKLLSRERIQLTALAIILLSMLTWGTALFFFFSHLTSWHKTPAGSREGNRDCILLEFYDAHDVWHFMSAVSLFLSFLILLVLDDDLSLKRRDRIPVF